MVSLLLHIVTVPVLLTAAVKINYQSRGRSVSAEEKLLQKSDMDLEVCISSVQNKMYDNEGASKFYS